MKTDYNITQTLQRKMTALLGLICILNLAPVFSYPDGAPAQACVNIYPAGHINVTRDLNHTGEAWLNLDSFKGGSYIPGNKYTFTLQCTEQFDGMLVQGRLTADGKTPVGTFSSTDILRLSNCDPPNVRIFIYIIIYVHVKQYYNHACMRCSHSIFTTIHAERCDPHERRR